MKAHIVFDGVNLRLPVSAREPSIDQNQGTVAERLGEAACRICYDSYGKGRSSSALHRHILDVVNLSVYEHFNFTISIPCKIPPLQSLINRKGIWVEIGKQDLFITTNLRAILEWKVVEKEWNRSPMTDLIYQTLCFYGHRLAPSIIPCEEGRIFDSELVKEGLSDDQQWVSMWMSGSRGFSHEQVRHRFSMSQRSTRYVDESESDYVLHPLISLFLSECSDYHRHTIEEYIERSTHENRRTYNLIILLLEEFLTGRGVDKTGARKQARGAARGYLGNALETEMIFSASISGWRNVMIRQRASVFADAEIRNVYCDVVEALKGSIHGHRFWDLVLVPSPDGIGTVTREEKK